jgi:hypothetical protein
MVMYGKNVMVQQRYVTHLTISLPHDIPNLPFYNIYKNVDGDNIGSSYSSDIANSLFKDFDNMWSIEQLKILMNKLDFEKFRSCLSIKIDDREKNMAKFEYGSKVTGDSVMHFLIFLIKRKIGLN